MIPSPRLCQILGLHDDPHGEGVCVDCGVAVGHRREVCLPRPMGMVRSIKREGAA